MNDLNAYLSLKSIAASSAYFTAYLFFPANRLHRSTYTTISFYDVFPILLPLSHNSYMNAEDYIKLLELEPHPEGGYFRQTYRSSEWLSQTALPARFAGDRTVCTVIYYLLAKGDFSSFHRIKSDELWHFYAGSGLHIYLLHLDGRGEVLKLGDDLANGYSFQQMVPAGCWFASKPVTGDGFSFVGCTVAPGFDFADFELAEKDDLLKQYPAFKDWVDTLC